MSPRGTFNEPTLLSFSKPRSTHQPSSPINKHQQTNKIHQPMNSNAARHHHQTGQLSDADLVSRAQPHTFRFTYRRAAAAAVMQRERERERERDDGLYGTGILLEQASSSSSEDKPTWSRPRDLIGLCKRQTKSHPPDTEGRASRKHGVDQGHPDEAKKGRRRGERKEEGPKRRMKKKR